jgi:hypothetical protein
MSGKETRSQSLERRAKALFDAEVDKLDGHTRSRLAQARHAALAEGRRRSFAPWRLGPRALLPAGAAAIVALAVTMLWRDPVPMTVGPDLAALQDLEILLGEEELEMLEDLEFFAWLDEQPEFSQPPAADDVG